MTDPNTALPPSLRRALELLADPPTNPDVSKGYLDLLGTRPIEDAAPPQCTRAQALFASPVGSMLYDHTQAVMRRLFTAFQLRTVWLNIPPGGIALDVGCGTGSVTASLARAAGPDGLALGVDISEPMLARAVRAEAGPQIGFLRADAQRLPLRDEAVDAVISVAVLQLIPDPVAALAGHRQVVRECLWCSRCERNSRAQMLADCGFQGAAAVMIWFQTAKRSVISVRHSGALIR